MKNFFVKTPILVSFLRLFPLQGYDIEMRLTFFHSIEDVLPITPFYDLQTKVKDCRGIEEKATAIIRQYYGETDKKCLTMHLDLRKRGLIVPEDSSIPDPENPKLLIHVIYKGLRIPLEKLPKGVERIMVAEHFPDKEYAKPAKVRIVLLYIKLKVLKKYSLYSFRCFRTSPHA